MVAASFSASPLLWAELRPPRRSRPPAQPGMQNQSIHSLAGMVDEAAPAMQGEAAPAMQGEGASS